MAKSRKTKKSEKKTVSKIVEGAKHVVGGAAAATISVAKDLAHEVAAGWARHAEKTKEAEDASDSAGEKKKAKSAKKPAAGRTVKKAAKATKSAKAPAAKKPPTAKKKAKSAK